MNSPKLIEDLGPSLRRGDLSTCSRRIASALNELPPSPFHIVTELDFTNRPLSVARCFDRFLLEQDHMPVIQAVYTETNGFEINPDRWYLNLFAYAAHGGHDDYGWLGEWQSDDSASLTLKGMQRLQEVYSSGAFRDPEFETASYLASYLVVVRFQLLVKRSAPLMKHLDCPLLATSHDYDFIYEYNPVAETSSNRIESSPSDLLSDDQAVRIATSLAADMAWPWRPPFTVKRRRQLVLFGPLTLTVTSGAGSHGPEASVRLSASTGAVIACGIHPR